MATRFKATDLKEMIRLIVREEMTGVVKEVINEVLSERYLRQLAEAARPRGVGPELPTADDDDQIEETPSVLRNSDNGAYHHEVEDEDHVQPHEISHPMREGASREDVLSALFFEGTRPLSEIEASAPDTGVKLESIMGNSKEKRTMTEVWTQLAGVNQHKPQQQDKQAAEKREEMRLKMLRESLERPANG